MTLTPFVLPLSVIPQPMQANIADVKKALIKNDIENETICESDVTKNENGEDTEEEVVKVSSDQDEKTIVTEKDTDVDEDIDSEKKDFPEREAHLEKEDDSKQDVESGKEDDLAGDATSEKDNESENAIVDNESVNYEVTDTKTNYDQNTEIHEPNTLEIDMNDGENDDDKYKKFADKHSIKKLRELCKSKGLNTQGKKQELAERYLNHDSTSEDIVICS